MSPTPDCCIAEDGGELAESLATLGPGFGPQHGIRWTWWHTPVIPALGREKQKDQRLEVIFR